MSVGYGNPPTAGRFKKGRSGNPRGRPPNAVTVSTAYLFRKVANEAVAIEGGQITMTRWEALVRQIQTLALKKNASAARLLHQIREQFPAGPVPGDKYIFIVNDEDLKL